MSIITDWPAENYAIGAYIQATAANQYLSKFKPKSNDTILDIGCGDGSYSTKILALIPEGQLLGIDASENMLALAQQTAKKYANFSVEKANAIEMDYDQAFDAVVSFWCLQWTDNIELAFRNIYRALKPGGQVFTLFPSGDDPYMLSHIAVKASGQFPELNDFTPPMHYHDLEHLADKLGPLPYQQLAVERHQHSIKLPDLETFRRFVYGIGFYQGQIDDNRIPEINDAMVEWYDQHCQREFNGEYRFTFSPYWVHGKK